MGLAEFIYSVVLKPRPLKALANHVIRALLPRTVEYGQIKVVLNPKDPVVSGALAFRVYEHDELAFVEKTLRPGMTVLDIGANVGLYSAIAGKAVGDTGKVISFEPDPESFRYLQETVRENDLGNVQLVNVAVSDKAGAGLLFTSSSNRGDSRLYNNELSDGQVTIRTVRLDDYLPEVGIENIDFIKMDVQGFEGHVLAGLEQTIRRSPKLIMMSEFWPDGLQRAGSDPKMLLSSLEAWGLKLYEVGPKGETVPLTNKDTFIARFPGRKYTNVCAMRG